MTIEAGKEMDRQSGGLTMPDGVCASCNFYNPFVGICEYRRQYVTPTGICDEYMALEGDYEGESEQADT